MEVRIKNLNGYVFFLWLFLLSCNHQVKDMEPEQSNGYKLEGYDLVHPDKCLEIHRSLNEISGLACYNDEFVAVQDELGVLYFLNEEFQIGDKKEFYIPGDYEDVDYVNGKFYIVRSDGVLLIFDPSKKKKKRLKKHLTPLSSSNDVEGLMISDDGQYAYFLCKRMAHLKNAAKKINNKRAIYRYDIHNKVFDTTPIGLIKRGDKKVKPTAIRKHPISGDYWVLTSSPNKIVVLDSSFKEKGRVSYSKELKQPESLAINKHGVVYIASEAAGGAPKVCVFQPNKR